MAIRNPFIVSFSRAKRSDGFVVYTTSFWLDKVLGAAPRGQDVYTVQTVVDEVKALADGLSPEQLVQSVKGDHYNKITGMLHDALVRTLKVEVSDEQPRL